MTRQRKQEIDKCRKNLLDEIGNYEENCIQELETKVSRARQSELLIKKMKEFCAEKFAFNMLRNF